MNRRISNKEFRMMKEQPKFDLENRLIEFSLAIIGVAEMLPNSLTGRHLCGQLIRSGTSPAFNYAEAQSAESRKDFIHKMKISLKELRETYVCLQIIEKKPLIQQANQLRDILDENNQLISIFVKSIATARSNSKR